ncbi:MAG: PD-(D/E)XK nuclease family protein, partial [Clostridia bacterium]|nr:PD-(D/E)XK nuclease family protein [Clostridia bacterium]
QAYEPAAAHYMAISDGYVNDGEDKKTYYGASVADDDVAARFHEDGEKNYGISRDKDGHVKPSSSVLTKGELDAFVDYAKAVTESGANEIYGGYFQPTPYKEDACKYCALSGMCGYDCEVGLKTRAFSKSTVTKSNIVDALKGGDGDE